MNALAFPGSIPDPAQAAEIRLRVLSLGAGVQSTTLALMAAHGEIGPMPDCAIFADTGWEPLWHIDRLHLGDYVQIAAGVKIIMGGNHTHNTDFISTYPFAEVEALKRSYRPAGDTRIGNDVWIGMEAMIMPGVTIGDGAIIAARALVNQDVPPYAMVAGTPARVVRMRFGDDDIARLQALAWWDWPDDKVQALLPLIQQGEVALLEQAAARWQGASQGE